MDNGGTTRRRWPAREALLVAIGLAAIAGGAWIWLGPGAEVRATRLRMTAGQAEGLRHRIGEALRYQARGRGLDLVLSPSAGSEEALDGVDAGRWDVALVQGGLDPGDRPNLREVAALHVEPLHLMVRPELAAAVGADLGALRGRSINLGEPGSGTAALAREVLRFAGLAPGADYRTAELSYAALMAEEDPARLPDAVFTVSSLPSPVAQRLVDRHGYALVALPFGEAFALAGVLEVGRPQVRKAHVYDATIPAYAYGTDPPAPPSPTATLGTRLLVVADRRAEPEAIGRLLEAVFTTEFAQVARPRLDARLLDLPPELPMHEGTVRYLQRNKPLIAGDVVDFLEKGTSLAGAAIGGLIVLVQWLRRRSRRRRDEGFEAYLLRVADVERRGLELERSDEPDLDALLALQGELGRLKAEALDKFAEGKLEGDQLMSGFLTLTNDARDYLTRLILHRREALAKRSRDGLDPTGEARR